jgi:hypothetical protein
MIDSDKFFQILKNATVHLRKDSSGNLAGSQSQKMFIYAILIMTVSMNPIPVVTVAKAGIATSVSVQGFVTCKKGMRIKEIPFDMTLFA